jgi:hypothetical protein
LAAFSRSCDAQRHNSNTNAQQHHHCFAVLGMPAGECSTCALRDNTGQRQHLRPQHNPLTQRPWQPYSYKVATSVETPCTTPSAPLGHDRFRQTYLDLLLCLLQLMCELSDALRCPAELALSPCNLRWWLALPRRAHLTGAAQVICKRHGQCRDRLCRTADKWLTRSCQQRIDWEGSECTEGVAAEPLLPSDTSCEALLKRGSPTKPLLGSAFQPCTVFGS